MAFDSVFSVSEVCEKLSSQSTLRIMGVLLLLAEQQQFAAGPWKLLLTVGFLGGFTTFSSFSMETMTLVRGGSTALAALNILANLILGFVAVTGGLVLGRIIVRG